MKYKIHYHIEFLMRSDRDWVKSSPIPPVKRYGQITVYEEAVRSEADAVVWLNEIFENETAGKLVSLDGIDAANVMLTSLIVDKIVPD
ncbi:MAG: hypothetical protein VCE74_12210 [Alphaproteobacteria bacterium]|jgi:hypothetical protein